jgi:hypothetical protein
VDSALLDKKLPPKGEPRKARALTADEEAKMLALLPPLARDVVVFALYSMMRRG